MKQIKDGFLFTVGAWLALNVLGFLDGKTKVIFGKPPKACDCEKCKSEE